MRLYFYVCFFVVLLTLPNVCATPALAFYKQGPSEWVDMGNYAAQKLSGMQCVKERDGFERQTTLVLPNIPRGTGINCGYKNQSSSVTFMLQFNPPSVTIENPKAEPTHRPLKSLFDQSILAIKTTSYVTDPVETPTPNDGQTLGQMSVSYEIIPSKLTLDPLKRTSLWVDRIGYWDVTIRATYPVEQGSETVDFAMTLFNDAKMHLPNGLILSGLKKLPMPHP